MSGLSAPRILFGIHSISPYSRADKTPYGILKVIGSASLAISSSVEELYGGSQRFSWAAEAKTFKSQIDCKVKAYPGFLFTLFMGGTVTDNAAEALGSVTTLTNFKGTSVKAATTGIASVQVKTGSETSIKFASFVVVAASSSTVDVYAYSDVDFPRATAGSYLSDAMKIATGLTITTSGGLTDITNFGIQLVGGSGTIGMTTGDSATFSTRPENSGSSDITIGAAATALPAFGAKILAQKRATAEMCEITAYNCIAEGFPIPMEEMKFSETSIKITALYDSVADAVYTIRTVIPNTFI
jgi:hypothetical protein